nr:Chain B, Lac23ys_bRR, a basic mutant of LacI C-terminal tetramerization helix [Escherichia coli]8GOI_D Chain D, Lac23ys_bRR, a basic mutant of LacI C-terminal tetramerization helix [Escherichia coli]8GOI_F Chain F, Lac23ys_bRR, a basic mutant of LacI C-terminal tetramerization helix [Escherichia coli]8GOI_H Chain H, Lac23ys_bRR, a basic mutant of LacI C-terminal tetramerization helix [Escherichia coli]
TASPHALANRLRQLAYRVRSLSS